MQCALKSRLLQNQEFIIQNYGDEFWEWLCDTVDGGFTLAKVANEFPLFAGLANRTRRDYARVILRNVMDEDEHNPPIRRLGHRYFWN